MEGTSGLVLAYARQGLCITRVGDVNVEHVHVGPLNLSSGVLCGRDLFCAFNPFSVKLRPGTFPVVLTLARRLVVPKGMFGDRRIACVSVVLSEQAARTWTAPHYEREGSGGFPVDSWYACVADQKAMEWMEDRYGEDDPRQYEQQIRSEFRELKSEYGNNTYVDHCPRQDSMANVIGCFSGLGGGEYPVWVGRDADDAVVRVVMDFLYLEYFEEDPSNQLWGAPGS